MASGVRLFGGFAGGEANLAQRNPKQNVTVLDGGASGSVVVLNNGSLLDGFTVRNGRSSYGGGVRAENNAAAVIANNIIENNTASTDGGGIYLKYNASTVRANVIRNNHAGRCGGGIGAYGPGHIEAESPVIYGNLIRGNSSGDDGAGIWAYYSTPLVERNLLWANRAGRNGGGMFLYHGYSRVLRNHFWRNVASVSNGSGLEDKGGGGFYVGFHCIPEISGNVFDANRARLGGGIYHNLETEAQTQRNIFRGNQASEKGGAHFAEEGAHPVIVNNLIHDNYALAGGVLYIKKTWLDFSHNTLDGNSAESGAAIALENYSSSTIANNIIAHSTAVDGAIVKVDALPSPTVAGNCFWGNAPANTAGMPDPVGGFWQNIQADPAFLARECGAYQLTAGSPCIETAQASFSEALDFDGRSRPAPGAGQPPMPDIGAYEYGAGLPVLTRLAQVEALPAGTEVQLPRRGINGSASDGFFVQEPDWSGGLKVLAASPITIGKEAEVEGVLADLGGSRVLQASGVVLYGSETLIQPPALVQRGKIGPTGPGASSCGMVVKVAGVVTGGEPDGFRMSDGGAEVRVYCPAQAIPVVGSFCRVTGVADGQAGQMHIFTRSGRDVVAVP